MGSSSVTRRERTPSELLEMYEALDSGKEPQPRNESTASVQTAPAGSFDYLNSAKHPGENRGERPKAHKRQTEQFVAQAS